MRRRKTSAAFRRCSCPRTWAGRRAIAPSGRCSSRSRAGPRVSRPSRPRLEPAKARYVGDRIAFVVADTSEQARIAAELVEIHWEPLPAVVNVEDAAKEGAPKVWDDNAAGNLAFPLMMGNKE